MELKHCSHCVLDGTAEELVLSENGVCNFCHIAQRELAMAEKEKPNLNKMIEQIKKDGRNKKYDILVGISGGVDTSTVLHEAVKLGLRPYCYTLDNGHNTPQSDENIMRLVETLKVPLYRYTIDYDKFTELQAAFLKAGLINVEIPTDHLLMSTSLELASQYGIKWVISGGNINTESVMPPSWSYTSRDLTHIKNVYKKMIGKKLEGLPVCGLWKWNVYRWWFGIKTFYLLDYLDYDRDKSIELLKEKYNYQPYGEKHCESTFTWWFQNFYLYEKFGIDKRKAHLSSLIN